MTSLRSPASLLLCILTSLGVSGREQPNILLIVGEDHGAELSCYGDTCIETPRIDELARAGLLYKNGYVTQSVCSSSRSTIFTGLYPHTNGMLGLATHDFHFFKPWPSTYSLLRQVGYRTGLIGKIHVNPESVISDHIDFRYMKSANFKKSKVASYAEKAGEFFREESTRPFFMTVNYPDAHWPLQADRVNGMPKQLADAKKIKALPCVSAEGESSERLDKITRNYYNCMLRLDECVGQLLDELKSSGKEENTLVVFIGDHGAQMARAKIFMYEAGIRVPFIIRWPKQIPAGQKSKALVSTADLLPTFLSAAAATESLPTNIQGKALQATFESPPDEGVGFRRYLFCERNVDSAHYAYPQRSVRNERYKLIYTLTDGEDPAARICQENTKPNWSGTLHQKTELPSAGALTKAGYGIWLNPPRYQLYDLWQDPHEWRNLAGSPSSIKVLEELKAELSLWQKETNDPLRHPTLLGKLMDECRAVTASKRRSPAGAWKYLDYLHPEQSIAE